VLLTYLAGFVGIDTFTYITQGGLQPATVTVNVTVASCDSNSCTLGVCNVTTGERSQGNAYANPAAPLYGACEVQLKVLE
jgi:hypothetical protein